MSRQPESPDVSVTTKTRPRDETKTRRVPPYNVILANDESHSFEFVIDVLSKARGHSAERAFQLTEQAHLPGRAIIWTGPKEVAELKADQVATFHESRPNGVNLGPLGCTIEPAPGC